LKFYHFHDTSDLAAVKRPCSKRDYEYLRPDASNLAGFLLLLKKKHEKQYQRICETIQLAAPFFDEFRLLDEEDKDETLLEWRQKGTDYPFHPSQISDGTLRFICLATALLQPNPPSTIIVDEPELGLHPLALALLAELIKKSSFKTQVIVATQSASLISHFDPKDIIVVERKNGESVFRRLPQEKLKQWIDDYSLGELWEMNLLEGRPENE
jgi:predicted ATPase